ncbi:MAG: GMC oxidoreductase [Pseudomonadota bacterium]
MFAAAAAADIGIPVVPARRAVLTRDKGDGRSPCFWATECGRGCNIGAAFQTTTSLLPWARSTGLLTITTDAMVYEITTGEDGRANGARYIDKITGEHKYIGARAVVLAASAAESARILLNSNARESGGLANASGQVGRNLMDTVGSGITGRIPALEDRPRYNEDGAMGMHVYVPFWLYEEQAAGQLDFPRGYHLEVYSQFGAPGMGAGSGLDGYGQSTLESARRYYGSFIHFAQRGEMIPNENCYAEIDSETQDKFGIPVLKFHYKHSEHEYAQVAHAQQTSIELIERMGGRVAGEVKAPEDAIAAGGVIIHEIGTARMGASASDSVTNSYGQTWDVPNLFILDGAIFASKAHKNPTLTILTLAMRGADHLVNEMKRGAI